MNGDFNNGYKKGFIHPQPHLDKPPDNSEAPLPSISMATLTASYPEVAHIFHLPFSFMTSPLRLRSSLFRGDAPYFCIDVSDLCPSELWQHDLDPQGRDEIGGGQNGKLEVWGLTGWYLTLFMRVLEAYK